MHHPRCTHTFKCARSLQIVSNYYCLLLHIDFKLVSRAVVHARCLTCTFTNVRYTYVYIKTIYRSEIHTPHNHTHKRIHKVQQSARLQFHPQFFRRSYIADTQTTTVNTTHTNTAQPNDKFVCLSLPKNRFYVYTETHLFRPYQPNHPPT